MPDAAETPDTRADGSLLIPEGSTLVHIGPPKTATTAVQGAFWAAREEIARQGVDYPGKSRHSAAATIAALGRPGMFSDSGQPATARWEALRAEIVASGLPRVVLSSEFLADATSAQVGPLLDSLRRPNVHVVITLRPLARIVPSHWQQSIQSGVRWRYDDWLHAMFDADGDRSINPSFWHRHRHDELVARWADAVGPDNVTAIVLDSKNPDLVLTSFEQLVGLSAGTLVAPEDLTNRSLTWPEVEALRSFNSSLIDSGLTMGTRRRLGHAGAAHYLKQFPADPEAAKVDVPAWVRPAVDDVAREIVEGLRRSPVRIVGDLDLLVPTAREGHDPEMPEPAAIAPEIAARIGTGALAATGVLSWDELGVGPTELPPIYPGSIETSTLEQMLKERARASVRRRWRKATSVVRRSSS